MMLLAQGYSALPELMPQFSSADSSSGAISISSHLETVKIFSPRPVIEMTAQCREGDKSAAFALQFTNAQGTLISH